MTLVRRLALKMSGAVVRFASPGCREWAEGLEREVASIGEDWRALGWAIGSVRVLFDRREAPLGSVEEIPAAARRLAAEVAVARFSVPLYLFLLGSDHLLKILLLRGHTQRVGCGMVVLSCVYLAVLLLAQAPQKEPADADIGANALYYRSELARLLDFHSRLWMWLFWPGVLLIGIGMVLEEPGYFREHSIFAAALLFIYIGFAPLHRGVVRKYQRRLYELDAVLAERQ
jgi:hypothetical protein